MEEKIITFSANEQGLQKTGGISHYASDTVSYVKAVFDLGENWQGFDEVRAVFKTSFDTRSAVLNSLGECEVPFEILMYKAVVRVNLVGSIITEEEVTDRLTTYSVEALAIDEDVPISGDSSVPITPSEYEQFVAKVANDANRAEAGATSAEASASNAESEAESALASAQASEASALRASGHAQNAQSAETSARAYAQNAQNSATSAENAKDDAIDARDEIRSMRANAETLEPNQSATASYSNGVLTLGIPKGQKGDTGDTGTSAGFGTVSASVDDSVGTPSVEVTASGTATAKNFAFAFHNLKGAKGDKGDDGTVPDLDLILPTDTASGDIASITDGQDVVPVKSLKVTLEPIQSGTGTPSPDNIRPISGRTECVTWVDGVHGGTIEWNQLVSADAESSSVVTNNGDGSYTVLSGGNEYYRLNTVEIAQNHKYLASCKSGNATACYFRVDGADGNPWISIADGAAIYDSPSSGTRRLFIRALNPTQNYTVVPQLSDLTQMFGEGNEPTTVEEFKALFPYDYYEYNSGETTCVSAVNGEPYNTYTTTLGRTVYGGTLDVVSGELVVDRAMVTFSDGTNWSVTATSGHYRAYTYALTDILPWNDNRHAPTTMICDRLSAGSWENVFVGAGVLGQTNKAIGFGTDSLGITDGASLGAWLANNPLTICYELATPQTYQLTPQTISLLHGNNNVWSDGEVELTYNADVGLYIDKKLGTSGTRTLSMTRTLTKSEDTDDTKPEETETKSELTKSDNIQLAED